MLFALILAAGMPWVEMSGGPVFLRESGRPGLGSGPLLRVDLGVPLAERAATEVWLSGAMEGKPADSSTWVRSLRTSGKCPGTKRRLAFESCPALFGRSGKAERRVNSGERSSRSDSLVGVP